MSNTRITVSRWTAEGDEPDVTVFKPSPDGGWRSVSNPEAPPCTLADVVFIEPGWALHVETTGSAPSARLLAAALPRSVDYLGSVNEIETDVYVLDEFLDSGNIQVAIDDQGWAAFPLGNGGPDIVAWLPCDTDELELGRVIPDGTTIAWASGIENGSMTSGTFSWSLIDAGDGYVCFIADPDEDESSCRVERRHDRTDLELAHAFAKWVDWDPVSLAVARAIETGGEFRGIAADLNNEWSDTCEVAASVTL